MRYTAANIQGYYRSYDRRLQFDILENGIAIARVTREANVWGYIEPMQFKFYTENSRVRFDTFCNANDMTTTCEALLANAGGYEAGVRNVNTPLSELSMPVRPHEVEILGPVGSAILETKMNWGTLYRMRKGDEVTAWGEYEDTFAIDGKYYISPYWTDGGEWLELTAEGALEYTAVGVPLKEGEAIGIEVIEGGDIIKGNADIEESTRGHFEPDTTTNTLPIYPKQEDLP